ncbi:MAG: MBL fold metallo-hydrolase [Candidatus Thorarchaeota archaeon]|jgi:L-ascorbate metabolism protein UlaG (beta-lactamase superfamily)
MATSRNSKYVIGAMIGVIVVSASIILVMTYNNQMANDGQIKLTLLNNAGVMIEAKGMRIYIDPYGIPSNYSDFPADAILITHPHFDHYRESDLQNVETNDTLFVFPENMTNEVEIHEGLGVNPGDSFLVGDINITAFYMYLPDYPYGLQSAHPRENNWTSYIIDIDGFKIFHAGDAKYMDEYEEIAGTIDVVFLPIYWDPFFGGYNESFLPVVDAIETIQPDYLVPTHFQSAQLETFVSTFGTQVEDYNCVLLDLAYFESYSFQL